MYVPRLYPPSMLALFVFAIIAPMLALAADPPAELASLTKMYEEKVSSSLKPLVDSYGKALKRLEKELADKGQLEEALAVRDYQVAVALKGTEEAAVAAPKSKAAEELAEIFERSRESKLGPLRKVYIDELEKMEKRMVDEGRLRDAITVKTVRLASAAEVKAEEKKPVGGVTGGEAMRLDETAGEKKLREESVIWWDFEDDAGRVAKDGSLAGNDGRLEGVKIADSEGRGKVAVFDQPTDTIVRKPMKKFDLGEVTISLWMKSNNSNPEVGLFSYATETDSNELLLGFYGNRLQFRHGESVNQTGFAQKPGIWVHLALTYDYKRGETVIYLDGEKYHEIAFPKSEPVPGGILMIGQDQDTYGGGLDPAQAFGGEMDDIVVVPRVLSRGEISSLHRSQRR